MTAESFQQLKEKIARRAEQISASGGTDLTVAVCAWTSNTRVVVLEWFSGAEPQREIIGGIPQTETPPDLQREICLGEFAVTGTASLSSAFRAIQQAKQSDRPIWRGAVDGQPVTVQRRPMT
ncbi:MAG: hypothetical protein LM523_06085 [Candidatus Contendobacter sp.]|nr:hypothetical protein [Candidatus Contendobacter sp.]